MKILPSKELLSEVISTELKKLVDPKNECCCEYHLAHKCKEWAIDSRGGQAYFIRSGNYVDWFCETGFTNGFDTKKFTADTEAEAIFKSCEWIMEQTK